MQQKSDVHIFQGMQRDIDPHKHKPEYLVDARNIRITNRGEDTSFAITSEKSTKQIVFSRDTIKGNYIGHCVLNQYVVIFTHSTDSDYIYRIEKVSEEQYYMETLYEGNLGFDIEHPIEAIPLYESEIIQKVYWTDGLNQPRVINIVSDKREEGDDSWNDDSFNFSPTLELKEKVKVYKKVGATGSFPAGVLQYCFTYYNKYGQETNIVWQSPLIYTSFYDRAGSPEESIANAFTVEVDNIDTKFDYIRLYSILRTSINGQPAVKRVADFEITDTKISIVDNGMIGDNVDPTELLYKEGEEIIAETICQKDGTLFLGNISITRPRIPASIKNAALNQQLSTESREIFLPGDPKDTWYPNQLTLDAKVSYSDDNQAQSLKREYACPQTFKTGEMYRLGIQLQYKNGKWSEPIYCTDYEVDRVKVGQTIPVIRGGLDLSEAYEAGYRKVRGLVVFPSLQERKVVTQGVLCPTVFSIKDRDTNSPYVQSSWFIRPFSAKRFEDPTLEADSYVSYDGEADEWLYPLGHLTILQWHHNRVISTNPFGGEIQGMPMAMTNQVADKDAIIKFRWGENETENTTDVRLGDSNAVFAVDQSILTMHSADIEFDIDDMSSLDLTDCSFRLVGRVQFNKSASDSDIQTSSPTISSDASGFIKRTYNTTLTSTTLAGAPMYSDYLVDDHDGLFEAYDKESEPLNFYVYPWNKSGSLNNDVVRPANQGTRTAVLSKKKISNIHIGGTITSFDSNVNLSTNAIKMYNFDELGMIRLGEHTYYGNIDTMLAPPITYGVYFKKQKLATDKDDTVGDVFTMNKAGFYAVSNGNDFSARTWPFGKQGDIGDVTSSLRISKESIRMRYKTTPHIVVSLLNTDLETQDNNISHGQQASLFVGEIYRNENPEFGGKTSDALKNNLWIPAGDAIDINQNDGGITDIAWTYGDTFVQRYDFLKTYAFTQEDPNSIIEIGSFRGEFRVNADGRYDRNRGQNSNLNMSPQNFNLWNPVYNQQNTFFNYRMLDEDYYELNSYPNSITWTLEHKSSEEVDSWTQITMASTIDLDGGKGKITSLNTFNDTIFAFQDKGISNILFNSRVQLNTSDGVPIEIGNNYKVDGSRYISDSVGCSNKWSICKTPSGLYFIDSNSRELYNISSNGLSDISGSKGMSNWFNTQDMSKWYPNHGIRTFYDFNNSDLYISTPNSVLNYSEKLGQFVSFFDYEKAQALFNIDSKFYGFTEESSDSTIAFWELFADDKPSRLFDTSYPYMISFISNQDSAINKIFTNMELRADWRDLKNLGNGEGVNYNRKDNSYNFFDYIQVSNEYQNSDTVDSEGNITHAKLEHLRERPSNLKNKFRVWGISLPRDSKHKRDRISNPWAKITLFKSKDNLGDNPFVLHDLSVQYYI